MDIAEVHHQRRSIPVFEDTSKVKGSQTLHVLANSDLSSSEPVTALPLVLTTVIKKFKQ